MASLDYLPEWKADAAARPAQIVSDYQVIDEGAMTDKIYNFKGDTFAPDYDLFLWYWYSDPDPNFILSVLTKSQVGSWSDTQWTDAEYDRLYYQQQTTIDPQARKELEFVFATHMDDVLGAALEENPVGRKVPPVPPPEGGTKPPEVRA